MYHRVTLFRRNSGKWRQTMSVTDELRDLIEQLEPGEARAAVNYLRQLLDERAAANGTAYVPLSARMQPAAQPGQRFFAGESLDLVALARQQGVGPVRDPDELVGDFWPADEPVDDFIATVRSWRHEAGHG
jgi:hypothetical protein